MFIIYLNKLLFIDLSCFSQEFQFKEITTKLCNLPGFLNSLLFERINKNKEKGGKISKMQFLKSIP